MVALRNLEYQLFVPFGENTRSDLIIDDGKELQRVQCKTGRLRNGSVVFSTASTYGHHPNPKVIRRTYAGDIDFFAVYCPDNERVYLVPIDDVPTRCQAMLRVTPARNGQWKNVRPAAVYDIGRVIVG